MVQLGLDSGASFAELLKFSEGTARNESLGLVSMGRPICTETSVYVITFNN